MPGNGSVTAIAMTGHGALDLFAHGNFVNGLSTLSQVQVNILGFVHPFRFPISNISIFALVYFKKIK